MTTALKLNAKEMIQMLRRHYLPEGRPAGGVFAPEIMSPDGRRKADLIWQSVTKAGEYRLVGHEVKVSRSDVIAEIQDPTKAEAWMQFCDQWWLVVSDPEILKGLEIPETWGIMAPPSGRLKRSMTVVKPAAILKPIHQADGLRRLVSWQLTQSETIVSPMRYTIESQQRELNTLRDKVYNSKDIQKDSPQHERIAKIVLKTEDLLKADNQWMHRLNDKDVIDALVDLTIVKTSQLAITRALQSLSHPAERLRESIRRVETDIKNLQNVTKLDDENAKPGGFFLSQ
jgi:hypothetical protein